MTQGERTISAGRDRTTLLREGLWLSGLSVFWGVGSAVWAITSALGSHSLGVLALGLNLAADVSGSVFLVCRLRGELHQSHEPERAERIASVVVGCALLALAAFLGVESIMHLATAYRPHPSAGSTVATAVSLAVLTPLGLAKRWLGVQLTSPALRGDGSLSLLGAAIAGLALLGLVLDQAFGWWWADALAALVVAVFASVEGVGTVRGSVL